MHSVENKAIQPTGLLEKYDKDKFLEANKNNFVGLMRLFELMKTYFKGKNRFEGNTAAQHSQFDESVFNEAIAKSTAEVPIVNIVDEEPTVSKMPGFSQTVEFKPIADVQPVAEIVPTETVLAKPENNTVRTGKKKETAPFTSTTLALVQAEMDRLQHKSTLEQVAAISSVATDHGSRKMTGSENDTSKNIRKNWAQETIDVSEKLKELGANPENVLDLLGFSTARQALVYFVRDVYPASLSYYDGAAKDFKYDHYFFDFLSKVLHENKIDKLQQWLDTHLTDIILDVFKIDTAQLLRLKEADKQILIDRTLAQIVWFIRLVSEKSPNPVTVSNQSLSSVSILKNMRGGGGLLRTAKKDVNTTPRPQ
jgi:hypothetical protein